MSRVSAFRGTWEENKRPHVVLAPDAYVAIQGQTTVVTCGECNRTIDVNKYLTGVSTEASVDSPPGSATINLSVPDTDVNNFYIEGNLVIIPMMEIEIFAKGYYTVGGLPQYYRIFWGMVISVTKSWSNGTTSISISCKDILHWWEKTNVIINPSFTGSDGASCGYQIFGNQFAGLNPYTIIISLAKEAMGDFSITDGSYGAFKPEGGLESPIVGQYANNVMGYWQKKFGNIWNSLVLYGTSGTAYTFEGMGMDVSPMRFASTLFQHEATALAENELTAKFKVQPSEIAAFKVNLTDAGNVSLFQNTTQSKLSLALTARDQCLFEFYCDTTGDIIFKPPFYNLNVIPNKPVSWINDFEIIDDSISDSEAEVVTHMTSSGNAYGGVVDPGVTDEITIPRTGVMDWHLLRRYGWRRQDFQCEWAGSPNKLFWFLIDYMDRLNAKRHSGSVTIPMRPEIRMGFPVWIPCYDSFYYVNAVSHNYSPGGQATTTLTLSAKRSKFIAPKNIGRVERVPGKTATKSSPNAQANNNANKDQKADLQVDQTDPRKNYVYKVSFDGSIGQTAGLGDEKQTNSDEPLIIRDPTTGKILGYPNVVMVYRTTFSGEPLAKNASKQGKVGANSKKPVVNQPREYTYGNIQRKMYLQLQEQNKNAIINRIRYNRYETGMTNAGLYDYAVDVAGDFKEMVLIPITSILWGTGTTNPGNISGAAVANVPNNNANKSKTFLSFKPEIDPTASSDVDGLMGFENFTEFNTARTAELQKQIDDKNRQINGEKGKSADGLAAQKVAKNRELSKANSDFLATLRKNHQGQNYTKLFPEEYNDDEKKKFAIVTALQAEFLAISQEIADLQNEITGLQSTFSDFKLAKNLNVSVRPVSDEFGFEVIGHNRYGRGVFVDRGQMKLKFTSPETNQLRIQFAAVGNMLTETPTNLKFGLQSDTTPSAFEKMQPDDWVTGASSHASSEVTLTSVNTFSSAINHQIEANAQIGAIFIEADATRRSKTIWELQPKVATGLDDIGFPECNCQISKFDWYSLLPKTVLQTILSTQQTVFFGSNVYLLSAFTYVDSVTGEDTTEESTTSVRSLSWLQTPGSDPSDATIEDTHKNAIFAIYEKKDSNGVVTDTIRRKVDSVESAPKQVEVEVVNQVTGGVSSTKPDFFTVLNEYLVNRFNESYTYNMEREKQDTGLDLNVETVVLGAESYIDPNSVLGASGGALFDRAAQGDPDALQALQDQTHWGWSASEKALDNLNKTAAESKNQINAAWNDIKKSASETGDAVKNLPKSVGQHLGIVNATNAQPQPTTPAALVINTTTPPNPFSSALPTNPFPSNSHTGTTFTLPTSPTPPKKTP